jgi:hypothetical protein
MTLPVHTSQCEKGSVTQWPDDVLLGAPHVGVFTNDIRCLYTPLLAAWPHRIASDIMVCFTEVPCVRSDGTAYATRLEKRFGPAMASKRQRFFPLDSEGTLLLILVLRATKCDKLSGAIYLVKLKK